MSIPSIQTVRELANKAATCEVSDMRFLIEYLHDCDYSGLKQIRHEIDNLIESRFVKSADFQSLLATARTWSAPCVAGLTYKKGETTVYLTTAVGLVIHAYDVRLADNDYSRAARQTALDALRDYIGKDPRMTAQSFFSEMGIGILYTHPADAAIPFRKFANDLIRDVDYPPCE